MVLSKKPSQETLQGITKEHFICCLCFRATVPLFFVIMCMYLLPLIARGPDSGTFYDKFYHEVENHWWDILLQVRNLRKEITFVSSFSPVVTQSSLREYYVKQFILFDSEIDLWMLNLRIRVSFSSVYFYLFHQRDKRYCIRWFVQTSNGLAQNSRILTISANPDKERYFFEAGWTSNWGILVRKQIYSLLRTSKC